MANQIQATVYQIDGNPLPSPIVISFLTSDIMIRKNSYGVTITYYPSTINQLQEQTFLVDDAFGTLVNLANSGGTTQIFANILEIDGDPQRPPDGIGYSFPASAISIWPSVNAATGVNSFIEFKNKRYSAAETEAELTAQANVNNALPYKVYTALLTQSGGSNAQPLVGGSLTIGVTYYITNNTLENPGDFTNVGAPNNLVDTQFVATGTTPANWGGGELEYNTGAPVVTVLENTIGNIWFTYNGDGSYILNSNGLFTENKTYSNIQIVGDEGSANQYSRVYNSNNNIIYMSSGYVDTGLLSNDILLNTPIEIRVYN